MLQYYMHVLHVCALPPADDMMTVQVHVMFIIMGLFLIFSTLFILKCSTAMVNHSAPFPEIPLTMATRTGKLIFCTYNCCCCCCCCCCCTIIIIIICRYVYCVKCFGEIQRDTITVGDDPLLATIIPKSHFKEMKNNSIDREM